MATTNALSNYAENELLDHVLGTGAFTAPTATWVQLHTGAPGEDCTANVSTTAPSGSRVEATAWAAAASRATSTSASVQFTGAATETITHYSVWDSQTGGNPLFYGDLTTSRAIVASDLLTFASGDIDIDFAGTALSTFAGNALLDHVTGTSAMTAPSNVFVQFHTGDPTAAGTSNVATLSTRSAAGAFSAASGGATDNDAAITATGAATETLTHISLWGASTGGNCLWFGALTTGKAVVASDPIQFGAAALAISLL